MSIESVVMRVAVMMMTSMAVPNAGVVTAIEGGVSLTPSSIICIFCHARHAGAVRQPLGLAYHESCAPPKMQRRFKTQPTFGARATAHFVPCTTNIGSLIPFAGEMSIALTSAQSALNL